MGFRVVNQSFWDSAEVIDEYSCEDKYFWLYLLTNPQANYLGVYQLPMRVAAFQLGYSKEQVSILLDRFENKYHKIKYNQKTQEIAIGEYLYHGVIKGGKPVTDAIGRDLSVVKDFRLVHYILSCTQSHIQQKQALANIYNYIYNYIKKLNVNVYDNDNVGESYHESLKQKSTSELKKMFIDFWNRYPKKLSKAQAEKAFDKLNPNDNLYQVIIDALEKQKLSKAWQKDDGQYIPYASTWLNNKRWEDKVEIEPTKQTSTDPWDEIMEETQKLFEESKADKNVDWYTGLEDFSS